MTIEIAYYSWSGKTKRVAQLLQQAINGRLYQIKAIPGTFSTDMDRTSKIADQQRQTNDLPQLDKRIPDLSDVDILLVGGPVWSGQLATPLLSFAHSVNSFPNVAPFYTSVGKDGNYEMFFQEQYGHDLIPGLRLTSETLDHEQELNTKIQQWSEVINDKYKTINQHK